MRRTRLVVLLYVLIGLIGQIAYAQSDGRRLTPTQLAKVERGERVVISEDRRGSPWPAVTVFAYADAPPDSAAAVFTNYASHASYIPGLTLSRISKRIDANTAEVDYTLDVPLVRDEDYTVRDRITRDTTGAIRVDWMLVRATSTKAIAGYARFHPYTSSRSGRRGTLIEYYNFVIPGSRLAAIGFIRTRAVSQVEETVRAIVGRIEGKRQAPSTPR